MELRLQHARIRKRSVLFDRTKDEIAWTIAREILLHLKENPDARDTAEGIRKWWLPAHGPGWEPADVERAISYLGRSGFLEEFGGGSLDRVFGLKKDAAARIVEFLN
jgi:hypothetical protein